MHTRIYRILVSMSVALGVIIVGLGVLHTRQSPVAAHTLNENADTAQVLPHWFARTSPVNGLSASTEPRPLLAEFDVDSDITSDEIWTSGNIYNLTDSDKIVEVVAGVTLTIEPGVIVRAGYERELKISGHLEAVGTSSNPILFREDEDHTNEIYRWRGLTFDGGSGNLEHVIVRFAGRDNSVVSGVGTNITMRDSVVNIANSQILSSTRPTLLSTDIHGLYAENSHLEIDSTWFYDNGDNDNDYALIIVGANSFFTLTSNIFENNGGYVAQVDPEIWGQGNLSNNVITNNGLNWIRINGGTFAKSGNLLAQDGLETYEFSNDVTVPAGVTMTVDPAMFVRMDKDSLGTLIVAGHLEAVGASDAPITFTSSTDDGGGQWRGIDFNGGTGNLSYVTLRNAGRDTDGSIYSGLTVRNSMTGWVNIEHSRIMSVAYSAGAAGKNYGVYVQDGYALISDTIFSQNGAESDDYGVYVGGNQSLVTVTQNTFEDNVGYAVGVEPPYINDVFDNTFTGATGGNRRIRIIGGVVPDASFLTAQTGLEGYELQGDLTVPPTVTLSVEPGLSVMGIDGVELLIQGHLQAVGTTPSPIVFTSDTDAGIAEWSGLVFDQGTGDLSHVAVRHAGDVNSLGIYSNIALQDVLTGEVRIRSSEIMSVGAGTGANDYGLYAVDSHLLLSDTLLMENGTSASGDEALRAVGTDSVITVVNNTFQDNMGYAVHITPSLMNGVRDNVFSGTTGDHILRVLMEGGAVPDGGTFFAQSGLDAYELLGDLVVPNSVTFTLQGGVAVKSGENVEILVRGHMQARGDATAPVTLTSDLDSGPAEWVGLAFDGGTGELNYVTVRYAGDAADSSFGLSSNVIISNVLNGEVRLFNSHIISGSSASPDYGLYVMNSHAQLQDTAVNANGGNSSDTGFYIGGQSIVTMTGGSVNDNWHGLVMEGAKLSLVCVEVTGNPYTGVEVNAGDFWAVGSGFFGNGTTSGFDFDNNTGGTLNATYNWWGQDSGPASGQIEGDVETDPWLTDYVCITDLGIHKESVLPRALAGIPLSYTIAITNHGPAPATSIVVSDVLPMYSHYVSAEGASCVEHAGVARCDVEGTLPISATNMVTVWIRSNIDGLITNVVHVSAYQDDLVMSNNVATATAVLSPATNLNTMLAGISDPVRVGYLLSYTVVVSNPGPSLAKDIVMTHTLPSTVSLLSLQTTGLGMCTAVTCTWPTIDRDAFVEASVVVTPAQDGLIGVQTEVMPDAPPPEVDRSDNITTTWIRVDPVVNLTFSMQNTPDPIQAGEAVTYTLTLTNSGPSLAQGTLLTEVLPTGSSFVTATFSDSGAVTQVGDALTLTVDSLPVNLPATVDVVLAVPPDARGTLTHEVYMRAQEFEPDVGDNWRARVRQVEAWADLMLTHSYTPTPPVAGELVTYSFTLLNLGPADATNTMLTATLPALLWQPAVVSPTSTCTLLSHSLTCTLGNLYMHTPSTTVVITGYLAPAAGTGLTVLAGSAADEPDANPTNSQGPEHVSVSTHVDLQMSKMATPDPAIAGAPLTYTLVVTNHGPSDAGDVMIVDTLPPEGISFYTATTALGTIFAPLPAPDAVTYTLGALRMGQAATVTLVVTPSPAWRLPLVNTATVKSGDLELDTGDNQAVITTSLAVRSDFEVAFETDPAPARAGETLTYTFTVLNPGPSLANDVLFTTTLPVRTTYVDSAVDQGQASLPPSPVTFIAYSLGTMDVGQTRVVTLSVTVDEDIQGTLVHTTTVTAEDNPAEANAWEVGQVPIYAEADLTLDAWAFPDPVTTTGTLFYTAVVTNNGPAMATRVVMTHTLPSEVMFVSASQGCTSTVDMVRCALEDLALFASSTTTVAVTVEQSAASMITNTIHVTSAEVDLRDEDNTMAVRVNVIGERYVYLPLVLRGAP